MNPVLQTLIRTALADLQPRLRIAQRNVSAAEVAYDDARAELEVLEAEAEAYRAALPAEPEPETDEG